MYQRDTWTLRAAPAGPDRRQPLRRLVSVRDRALPEPEIPPDIRPVSLDRPAVPLIQPQLIRGNVHQPRDAGDSLVRDLAASRREPAVHRIEPEQKSEPELRRATPPGQLLQLITDQRPVPDQLLIIQHTRHEASGSLASTAATSRRRPDESGSILAAHDQPRPGDPPRILSQPAGVVPDLGQRNRVYLVTAVLPTPGLTPGSVNLGLPSSMARLGCHQPFGRTGIDLGGPLAQGRARTCLPLVAAWSAR